MYGVSNTVSGSVDLLAWVMPEAFDASAFLDGYPVVNVRCESLDGLGSFGDEYREASAPIQERVSELGDTLANARYDSIRDMAQKQRDEGEKQLAEGKQKVADGEQQLKEGREQLAMQRTEGEAKEL